VSLWLYIFSTRYTKLSTKLGIYYGIIGETNEVDEKI